MKVRYQEVFVPGGFPNHTYNPRVDLGLEDRLREVTQNHCKLVTVTGQTKSGKTVLTRRILPREDCVWVDGGTVSAEDDFWQVVLEQLNLFQTTEEQGSTDSQHLGRAGLPCLLTGDCTQLNGIIPLGPFRSTDSGLHWEKISTPNITTFVTDIGISSSNSYDLYISTMSWMNPYGATWGNSGVFKSTNDGINWVSVNNGEGFNLTQYPIYKIIIDRNSNDTIYALSMYDGIFKSSDGGGDWTKIKTEGLPTGTIIKDIGIASQWMYATTSNGVYILK